MSINNQLAAMQEEYRTWRVVIVHDWLVVNGGAEKVLAALLKAFPQADVMTLVNFLPASEAAWLAPHRIVTSCLQRMPFARRYYRHYLPMMSYAIEQFDLRGYDLVISSSHAVAKGVITHPGQQHICYCHTPMRYAWDMKEHYLENARFRLPLMETFVRKTLKRLRQWDYFGASQVDHFIANSYNVAQRISKYYRREASVLYPPVDIEQFVLNTEPRDDYYLAASRLVPYKRLDLIIEAFKATPHRRLKIVGDGPEYARLAALAEGHTHIELLGYQPNEQLITLMSQARGFIFAADEDFGILPLEAQACGTPVIAYGKGGALETVKDIHHGDTATGVLFEQQSPASLLNAIEQFEEHHFQPQACRQQAEQFSYALFWQRLQILLGEVKRAD
ncbi:MAG: glycosyl transferase group 1 protein [Halomonas sp. 54_146]|nr:MULTISPECIES: glycosyltransferase [unclassified Halomonas]KUJ89215.1 MAG: glycosyl transferase group 1 protein [Halomonas sp. 54_146]HAA46063.1 glycosyl transferase family 1 [Halomonas sp.]